MGFERPFTIGVPQGTAGDPTFGITRVPVILNSEGLAGAGFDGRPVPWLAESWSRSDDGLTWRLRLHENLMFDDGTRLDAAAAADAVRSAAGDPQIRGRSPGLLDVEEVWAEGSLDLYIRLSRPSAFLLDDLNIPITRPGQDGRVLRTGPFYVTSTTDHEIAMLAHDNYYRGTPKLEQVNIRAYNTLRTAWAGLLRGEVDMMWEVADDAVEFVQSDAIEVYSFLRPFVYLIALNSSRPGLDNPLVRRALNLAVDREAIIDSVLRGRGLAASTPIWPMHWAVEGRLASFPFEPYQARLALESVSSQLPPVARAADRPPARLRFTCLVPEDFTTIERLALIVQRQLYDIGVDMVLVSLPAGELMQRLQAGNFDAVALEMVSGPSLSSPYIFWHSPGEITGYNVFGYSSAAADRALDAMRHAADDSTFRAAVLEFQHIMLDDPPAIVLSWNRRARAVSRRFEVPYTTDRDILRTMWQWERVAEDGRR